MDIILVNCIVLLLINAGYTQNNRHITWGDLDDDLVSSHLSRQDVNEVSNNIELLMHNYGLKETPNLHEIVDVDGVSRFDIVGKLVDGSVSMIKSSAENLKQMGLNAINEVETATKAIQKGMEQVKSKLMKIVGAQREVFGDKMSNLTSKFEHRIVSTGYSVASCQEEAHNGAHQLFSDTLRGGFKCAEDRVAKIVVLLKNLAKLGKRSIKLAAAIVDQLTGCGDKDGNWKGTCLGGLLLDAQSKQALVGAEGIAMLNQVRITVHSIPLILGACSVGVGFKTAWGITKLMGQATFCYTKSLFAPKDPPQSPS